MRGDEEGGNDPIITVPQRRAGLVVECINHPSHGLLDGLGHRKDRQPQLTRRLRVPAG